MLGPMTAGDTLPAATVTVRYSDNNPFPITGAIFSGKMREKRSGQVLTLDPTRFSIVDGPNGVFSYSWTPTDLETPGEYRIKFKVLVGADKVTVNEEITVEADF